MFTSSQRIATRLLYLRTRNSNWAHKFRDTGFEAIQSFMHWCLHAMPDSWWRNRPSHSFSLAKKLGFVSFDIWTLRITRVIRTVVVPKSHALCMHTVPLQGVKACLWCAVNAARLRHTGLISVFKTIYTHGYIIHILTPFVNNHTR
jgi:hypothetical protein